MQYVRGEKSPRMPMGSALPEAVIASLAAATDQMHPLAAKPPNAHLDWLLRKPPAPDDVQAFEQTIRPRHTKN